MADKTVTLSESEWQQLVAILANATGYMTFQKLLNQLQRLNGSDGAEFPERTLSDDPDLPASLRRASRA